MVACDTDESISNTQKKTLVWMGVVSSPSRIHSKWDYGPSPSWDNQHLWYTTCPIPFWCFRTLLSSIIHIGYVKCFIIHSYILRKVIIWFNNGDKFLSMHISSLSVVFFHLIDTTSRKQKQRRYDLIANKNMLMMGVFVLEGVQSVVYLIHCKIFIKLRIVYIMMNVEYVRLQDLVFLPGALIYIYFSFIYNIPNTWTS